MLATVSEFFSVALFAKTSLLAVNRGSMLRVSFVTGFSNVEFLDDVASTVDQNSVPGFDAGFSVRGTDVFSGSGGDPEHVNALVAEVWLGECSPLDIVSKRLFIRLDEHLGG